MADAFIVLLHKGKGEIGGAFSTFSAASSWAGTRTPCNYDIIQTSIDVPVLPDLTTQFRTLGPGSHNIVGSGNKNK